MPIPNIIAPRFLQDLFFFSPTKYPIIKGKLKKISIPPNIDIVFSLPLWLLVGSRFKKFTEIVLDPYLEA